MNNKTKGIILISVIITIILFLSLIGTTFAYYIAKISGTPNSNNITGNTGNLKLTYVPLNVNVSDILPGWTLEKTFFVNNSSTANKILTYDLIFQNVSNNFTRNQDLVFKITCKSSKGTNCYGTGSKLGSSGTGDTELEFPTSGDVTLFSSSPIAKSETHIYTIYFKYKNETSVDQQIDMKKSFNTTVVISNNKKYTY